MFGYKYRRLGTFMIDLAIIRMFAQVAMNIYLGIVTYLGQGSGVSFSINDALALPILLGLYLSVLLIFIGVYVGYHWVCYRFIGTSLSRYFLRVKVVSTDNTPVSQSVYLRREFEKAVLCVATLGLYALYSGAQFFAFSRAPLHDTRNNTQVVDA